MAYCRVKTSDTYRRTRPRPKTKRSVSFSQEMKLGSLQVSNTSFNIIPEKNTVFEMLLQKDIMSVLRVSIFQLQAVAKFASTNTLGERKKNILTTLNARICTRKTLYYYVTVFQVKTTPCKQKIFQAHTVGYKMSSMLLQFKRFWWWYPLEPKTSLHEIFGETVGTYRPGRIKSSLTF